MGTVAEQFRSGVLKLIDAEEGYEWGKESPYGADCSGTVCYPLIRMHHRIRTDANDLYHKIFTIPVKEKDELDLNRVMAVFYVMKRPWKKLDGTIMPAGTVRHVTPVVGQYVVCDADWEMDRIILKTAKAVRLELQKVKAKAVWREINWDAVLRYNGVLFYNPDPEILNFINNTD